MNNSSRGILKYRFIAVLFLLFVLTVQSLCAQNKHQSVGLVLSGGGAKGIAHIGVIKALEENDIPIDYITGTSMGAIVGGLYACGYSPDEMLALIKSPGFAEWSSGTINPQLTYLFDREELTPILVSVNVGNNGKGIPGAKLPTSLINPLPMNYAFMELFAAYTAQCHGDFNKLFVPLRTVTSDIYSKHKIVLSSGQVSDGIRASMTFPLVFRPIEIDSVLVYDGGIYDNYPFDVMHSDFNPDIMIGSNVSGPDKRPQQNDMLQQLEDMIIQNNNYDLPEEWGPSMNVPVRMYGVLDWDRADTIYAIGYKTAMGMMDSIKSRVHSRTPANERNRRREEFKSKKPEVLFNSVNVKGGTEAENSYIKYLFTRNREDTFGLKQVKESYYRAITPGKLENLIPTAVPDYSTGLFRLDLKADVKDHVKLGFGGYLSTSTSSMVFLSAGYNTFKHNALTTSINAWLGQSYMAGLLNARINLRTAIPSALRFELVASHQKFYESDILFFKDKVPTFLTNMEAFARFYYSMAAGRSGRFDAALGIGHLQERFFPSSELDYSKIKRDRTQRNLAELLFRYELNTLDNPYYPTKGKQIKASLVGATGKYKFLPSIDNSTSPENDNITFGQLEFNYSQFFTLGKSFALGTQINALASTRKLQSTYAASIVLAPSFNPTPASYNSFNPAFRANSFATIGLLPVWKMSSMFQLRGTFHGFLPLRSIVENTDGTASYGKSFSNMKFFGEAAVVANFSFATLSAYGNYTSYPARNWNFGISLGVFVLAPRFLR